MVYPLLIPDAHYDEFKEMYKKKYDAFLNKKASYENELNREWTELYPVLKSLGLVNEGDGGLKNLINQNIWFSDIKKNITTSEGTQRPINFSDLSWLDKAKAIIQDSKRPLTTNEIIELLTTVYERDMPKQKAINSIPSTLSVAYTVGKISRELNKDEEYVYDLIKEKTTDNSGSK